MHIHKAYLNAKGAGQILSLNHDVKRALTDSKLKQGLVSILSTQATTAVTLIEADAELQKMYVEHIQKQIDETVSKNILPKRSHTGANGFHLRAALVGLSLTASFDQGRLLVSPFHDIIAIDFEPKPGRREFIISVLGGAETKTQ